MSPLTPVIPMQFETPSTPSASLESAIFGPPEDFIKSPAPELISTPAPLSLLSSLSNTTLIPPMETQQLATPPAIDTADSVISNTEVNDVLESIKASNDSAEQSLSSDAFHTQISSTALPYIDNTTNSAKNDGNATADGDDEINVDGCFGKIRTASSVDQKFKANMDMMTQMARLDKIDELLRKKIRKLCTAKEAHAAETFLDARQMGVDIARMITTNLTKEERDILNLWESVKDVLSQRAFYLYKYQTFGAEADEMKLVELVDGKLMLVSAGDAEENDEIKGYVKGLFLPEES
ncbi:unnamed protein product [Anisakis simplex]|uniref:Caprin-1_dimer domain-containing protein n=1 Tax=Anisakis simplex TaxID=6269 RepID=A0A0M3KDM0_ANISI|nr:unnamed protein product [Anisakis simplex]